MTFPYRNERGVTKSKSESESEGDSESKSEKEYTFWRKARQKNKGRMT